MNTKKGYYSRTHFIYNENLLEQQPYLNNRGIIYLMGTLRFYFPTPPINIKREKATKDIGRTISNLD